MTPEPITVKIPQDRIGVLIGHKGTVKWDIEKRSKCKITVDSNEGEAYIEVAEDGDPLRALRVAEMIKAIGRGFSPEVAVSLLDDPSLLFEVISLSHLTQKTLKRIKGRIIGRNGRTRRAIEDLAGVEISIYGKTISVIGDYHRLKAAHDALEMLINGAPHSSVYSFLERIRRVETEEKKWHIE